MELYAVASQYPYFGNSHFREDAIGKHISAATATLPPEVIEAAQARGRSRDLSETAVELLEELKNLEWGD